MSGLTALQAINLLLGEPASYSSPEALRGLASQVSVDAPGKVTTLYSGTIGNDISAGDIVKTMAAQGDNVRIIGNTEAAKFLGSDAFIEPASMNWNQAA